MRRISFFVIWQKCVIHLSIQICSDRLRDIIFNVFPFPKTFYMQKHTQRLINRPEIIYLGATFVTVVCAIFELGGPKRQKPKEVYDHTQFPKLGSLKSTSRLGGGIFTPPLNLMTLLPHFT